jgi:hypothetical protein
LSVVAQGDAHIVGLFIAAVADAHVQVGWPVENPAQDALKPGAVYGIYCAPELRAWVPD